MSSSKKFTPAHVLLAVCALQNRFGLLLGALCQQVYPLNNEPNNRETSGMKGP